MDGFSIGYVPVPTDATGTDFTYTWNDITFTTRVWEVPSGTGAGVQVLLQILVLRGSSLSDLASVRAFLGRYHQRSLGEWELTAFDQGDVSGLLGTTEAFWCPRPGVAVEVRSPNSALDTAKLIATARGVTPEPAP